MDFFAAISVLIGAGLLVYGYGIWDNAASSIHQIAALLVFLIAAIMFLIAAVCASAARRNNPPKEDQDKS